MNGCGGDTDEESDLSFASPPGYHPAMAEDIFKPTGKVGFNPLPSTSAKSSKLKLNLIFDSQIFVAGESITGKLEVLSSSESYLYLGAIQVELSGFEGNGILLIKKYLVEISTRALLLYRSRKYFRDQICHRPMQFKGKDQEMDIFKPEKGKRSEVF